MDVVIPANKKSRKKVNSFVMKESSPARSFRSFQLSPLAKSDSEYSEQKLMVKSSDAETKSETKKSMKKRIRNFRKKCQISGTPLKTESKLAKIQKAMLKSPHHYQHVIGNEVTNSFGQK